MVLERRLGRLASLVFAGILVLLMTSCGSEVREVSKPNILFILTDDLDAESVEHMPTVQKELIEKGTTFENGILTLSDCCPSRATILRGQYAHNHGIGIGVRGQNRAESFRELGLENSTVATWLNNAGYETALMGKYLNGYDYSYVPPGWDNWYAGVGRDVWSHCLNENGEKRCHRDQYPDALLTDKAEKFIQDNKNSPAPLFLWLSFSAPHGPAFYLRQDRNKFSDTPLPKSPSFNEKDVSDKPSWVKSQPLLTTEQIESLTIFYRNQLRSLQTVDRAVGRLVDALADTGRLDNTYLVFWTDNGLHRGQHRLGALKTSSGKTTPYVEDIRVPLIVRGPSVSQAVESQDLILNTDIAPTFAELGKVQVPDFVDGRSFAPLLIGETPPWRTAGLIENRTSRKLRRPAYTGIITENRTYVEYENGEKEFYYLEADPHQLENVYSDTDSALITELESRLEALEDCAGEECRVAEDGP
jgi:N-acetylglucosamine-6-sulfatase